MDLRLSELSREIGTKLDHNAASAGDHARRLRQELGARVDAWREGLSTELGAVVEAASRPTTARLSEEIARLDARLAELAPEIARHLDERLAARLDGLGQHLEGVLSARAELSHDLGSIARRLEALETRLVVTQRAVAGVRPRGPAPDPAVGHPPGTESRREAAVDMDALYAAFEDCFRGTREDIGHRQTAHLPLLQAQDPKLGELPVIDLGCGRGEWLELLGRHGIRAVGVDLNRIFLAENVARGLAVVEADALAHLRGLPDGSARAVTGFHIIEHLPFDVLLAVFEESLRVLADGGLALFETPNPENLVTAAHKFYYDPTHRHPIPPEVATFLLRAQGYRDVRIVRLHENRDPAREQILDGVLRGLLFGPQDYAVLGYR
jgi:SAM-dependent methyltransferase